MNFQKVGYEQKGREGEIVFPKPLWVAFNFFLTSLDVVLLVSYWVLCELS